MKIRVMSDLHTEGCVFKFKDTPDINEVLVLAGDISNSAVGLANTVSTFAPLFRAVVVVKGNHEYYRCPEYTTFNAMFNETIDNLGIKNVHLLDRSIVLIDDVTFIGATLWTDFRGNKRAEDAAERGVNDFRLILDNGNRINAKWVKTQFMQDFNFITNACNTIDGKKVVVTHFPPIVEFQHKKWGNMRDNPINGYFINSLGYKVTDLNFDVFISGHTHDSSSFEIKGKKFICNPRGYIYNTGEPENRAFDPNLVIEM